MIRGSRDERRVRRCSDRPPRSVRVRRDPRLWTPPATAGWSIDGWDVERRKAEGRKELRCQQLTAAELQTLHRILRVEFAFGEIRLRQADCPGVPRRRCPTSRPTARPKARRLSASGALAAASARRAAERAAAGLAGGTRSPRSASRPGPRKRCAVYDVRLPERHRIVQVRAGLPRRSRSRCARARPSTRRSSPTRPACRPPASRTATSTRCSSTARSSRRRWTSASRTCATRRRRRRRGRARCSSRRASSCRCAPSTGRSARRRTRRTSRSRACSPTRTSTRRRSTALADLMNGVAADAKEAAPVWSSTVTREEPDDPFVEVRIVVLRARAARRPRLAADARVLRARQGRRARA